MKTVQQMLDLKPTTLCPALYKWSIKAAAMLLQQAEQIEALTKERDDAYVQSLQLSAENKALKADAERWKTIKPHFYFDNEGGHGFWNCSISSESWTVDGIIPDAAIDAMKG